jgi:hypothetical protein
MLLSTLEMPPVEEEVGGGRPILECMEHGAAEIEGTSMVMIGAVRACGLMLVISTSFTKSMPMTFSIIIMIEGRSHNCGEES